VRVSFILHSDIKAGNWLREAPISEIAKNSATAVSLSQNRLGKP
jgi:hypothetical protein